MRLKLSLRKILSVIATSALLFNSVAPFSLAIAQEITPDPTPVDTSTPAADPTVAPTDTPTDQATATPDATIVPTDEPTAAPMDSASLTTSPTAQPEVQGTTTENSQPQAPPDSTTLTASPSVQPTTTPETPIEHGNISTTIVENIDLSTINLLNSNVDPSPTVTTDKPDYSPTSVVLISGSGFIANKTYTIEIASSDQPPVDFKDQIKADGSGSISYAYQLDGIMRPSYTIYIKDGERIVATTTFTDPVSATITDYSQCSNNTGTGFTSGDTGCRWINGNLVAGNSAYFEGDSTVQRAMISHLTNGTHTVVFQYDTTKSHSGVPKHAYDFLTDDKFSETWVSDADMCDGASANGLPSCSGLAANLSPTIPTDTNAAGFDVAAGANRHFKIRNGTISAVSIPAIASGSYAGDSDTAVTITFSVNTSTCSDKAVVSGTDTCTILITFGAHVSRQADWGAGNSAVSIPGSPYHVALSSLDGGAIGQKDNQMQAGAIVLPTTLTINKVCVPSNDTGKFNLRIDSSTAGTGADASCGGTTGAVTVTAASHTVSETAGTGTNLSNYTTVIGGDCASNGSITLAAGDNKTCTITNTLKSGNIIVKKVMVGGTGSFAFTGDVAGTISSNNGTLTSSSVLPGTYTSVEGAATGWDLTGISCDDGQSTTPSSGNTGTSTATFKVDPGETVTCTFTNTKKPTLSIYKVCNPTGDTGTFNLQIDGNNVTTGTICGGWTNGQIEVSIGQHTVSEGGGNLSAYTSVISGDCNVDGQVSLAAGDVKSCTITNTRKPKLTIIKVTDPTDDVGKFNLSINGTQYATDVSNGGTTNTQFANIGSNTFAEAAGTSTDLSNYTSVVSGTGCGGSAIAGTITLAAGDNKTCTITNTRNTADLIVHKIIDADGNLETTGDQTDGGDWQFTVEGNGGDTSNPDPASTNSEGLVTFSSLKTGEYNVTETPQNGYDLVSATCDSGNQDGLTVFGVNVTEDTNCTFINTPNGQIHGFKWDDANGDGQFGEESKLGDWTINLNKWNGEDAYDFLASTTTDNNEGPDYGWYVFTHLFPGQYKVCEVLQGGWAQTFPGGDGCHEFSLPTDQQLTENSIVGPEYDFGNQGRGTVTVTKYNDVNDNRQFDEGEQVLSGWTINLGGEDSKVTGEDGQVVFNDVPAGSHQLSEDLQEGWIQTNTQCFYDEESIGVSQIDGYFVKLGPGTEAQCYIGNFSPKKEIKIVKTNDSPNTSAGSTVTYTLVVTNTGNVTLNNVSMNDVLPGGFSYVSGSTTGATNSDPSIAGSTLTWDGLGSLTPGNSLTLSYKVTIASDMVDGTYTNFASCKSTFGTLTNFGFIALDRPLTPEEIDCDPASSQVNLGHGQSFGGNLTPQVLGASTVLPATGSPTALLLVALGLIGTGFILKKKYEKN